MDDEPKKRARRHRAEPTAARPPAPGSPARAARQPGRDDLIPMRGFGPVPARLSPVKASDIYVKAPAILRLGITGGELAFHPWDESMAPFLGPRDLAFVMLADGKPRLAFLEEVGEGGIVLDANGTKVAIGPGELVECASVVLVHRNGRPEAVVRVAPPGPAGAPPRAAA